MTFWLFAAAFLFGMFALGYLIGAYLGIGPGGGSKRDPWRSPGPFSNDGGSGISPSPADLVG